MTKFEIDDEGFKIQMSEVPLWRLIQEIISNSLDEKAVSKIFCSVGQTKDQYHVEIIDDGKGFKKTSDIFTLYGDSYKRSNPEQSGRWNEGEKRFLAVAFKGFVETKGIRIDFDEKGRKETKRQSEPIGTVVSATFLKKDFEDEDLVSIVKNIRRIAVPSDKSLTVNDDEVEQKNVIKKFKATLKTVKATGPNTKLVQINRETDVLLYAKAEDRKAIIYERGIPVQELQENISWDIDIRQKIPQTTDRNVISDKYLHRLYAVITENTLDIISDDESDSNWINDGMKNIKNPIIQKAILTKRYGTDKVMIRSTTDSEANERAERDGIVLVEGKNFDPDVRANLKGSDVLLMAGQEYATNHFEDAKPVEPNGLMEEFAKVVKAVALDTLGKKISISFITTKDTNELAQYGGSNMTWNVARCGGKKEFDITNARMIGIMVHELAHDKLGQNNGHAHLSHDYLHEMQRIAGIVGSKGIRHWLRLVNGRN